MIALPLALALAPSSHKLQAGDQNIVGDVQQGEAIYSRCKACHSLERDRTGPRHCGLFGRKAGAIEGFRYSRAMKEADIVWSVRTLDAFLKNPRGLIPKNRMGYAGIDDAQERRALIAYLLDRNQSPDVCGSLPNSENRSAD